MSYVIFAPFQWGGYSDSSCMGRKEGKGTNVAVSKRRCMHKGGQGVVKDWREYELCHICSVSMGGIQ